MEMPSGFIRPAPSHGKCPPVPINLPALRGPQVTAGRTVGPRPSETLRYRWAFAMPWQRSGSAVLRQATGGSHGHQYQMKKQDHVQVHTDSTGTLTPQTPRNSHPSATLQYPTELLWNNQKAMSASTRSLYDHLHSHPPNSQDFNPSCRNFLLPFIPALLQALSPRLPCKHSPASKSPPACSDAAAPLPPYSAHFNMNKI